jgi:hypothetical protein
MRVKQRVTLAVAASVAGSAIVAAAMVSAPLAEAQPAAFVSGFGTPVTVASTVPVSGPATGDQNPYGVAVVGRSQGKLVKGNVLVSNFNNAANQQGTGTSIMSVSPAGKASVFARINAATVPGKCPGGIGLTTALTILDGGWVVVGSLPTTAGDPATSKAGCLLVLNSDGKVVETFSGHGINGPWDMTAVNFGRFSELFVTNVLNGTVAAALKAGAPPSMTPGPTVDGGTVLRLLVTTPSRGVPRLLRTTVIGSGFGERTDPAALVIGPTGVGIGRGGTLYVADTLSNRITAIPNALYRGGSAGPGYTVSVNGFLSGPLGLAIAPDGDILVANSGNGNLVEVTPRGAQVADPTVTQGGAGALFGLAVAPQGRGVYFVDDSVNTLDFVH